MQLLEFNSTDRIVVLKSGITSGDELIKFDNVPTVKVENGYYEVMQRLDGTSAVPVFRVPISNTNMLIKK